MDCPSVLARLGIISCLFFSGLSVGKSGSSASAQIVPDATLGAESSVVVRDRINGLDSDRIDGGAIRTNSLFHSFSDFNVGEGRGAYFTTPDGVDNILSRVTGENFSEILGQLGVLGEADLFLLNPNGISFGPNATLDVAGSFTAAAVDGFTFEPGGVFSAVNPSTPPLLTVNVTPGLQWGQFFTAGNIDQRGNLVAGQNLTLSGGLLDLEGSLRASGDLLLQSEAIVFGFGLRESLFESGGDFRMEQPDGLSLDWLNPSGSVIRAAGDVSFDNYDGASLHILAGGRVIVPGDIEITENAPVNGLVETVQLSDGSTVTVNGQLMPTLDIRAGTTAVETAAIDPVRNVSADISIAGQIRNEGGTVFLTTQYQPNLELPAGDISVGFINTRSLVFDEMNEPTTLRAQGGDVTINGRGAITAGDVFTLATLVVDSQFDNSVAGDGVATASGGNIYLIADGDITTQALSTAAFLNLFLQSVSEETVETASSISNVFASATGGDITVVTQSSILTGDVESDAFIETARGLYGSPNLVPVEGEISGEEMGATTVIGQGGDIAFTAQNSVRTGRLTTDVYMVAYAYADTALFNTVVGNVSGRTIAQWH